MVRPSSENYLNMAYRLVPHILITTLGDIKLPPHNANTTMLAGSPCSNNYPWSVSYILITTFHQYNIFTECHATEKPGLGSGLASRSGSGSGIGFEPSTTKNNEVYAVTASMKGVCRVWKEKENENESRNRRQLQEIEGLGLLVDPPLSPVTYTPEGGCHHRGGWHQRGGCRWNHRHHHHCLPLHCCLNAPRARNKSLLVVL